MPICACLLPWSCGDTRATLSSHTHSLACHVPPESCTHRECMVGGAHRRTAGRQRSLGPGRQSRPGPGPAPGRPRPPRRSGVAAAAARSPGQSAPHQGLASSAGHPGQANGAQNRRGVSEQHVRTVLGDTRLRMWSGASGAWGGRQGGTCAVSMGRLNKFSGWCMKNWSRGPSKPM